MKVWSRSDDGAERQSRKLLSDLQQLPGVWAWLICIDGNFTPRWVVTVIRGLMMKTKDSQGNSSTFYSSYLVFGLNSILSMRTLHPYGLYVPTIRLSGARGCFKYAAAKIWNDLPPPIRAILDRSLPTFRKACRRWLLERQSVVSGCSGLCINKHNLLDVTNQSIKMFVKGYDRMGLWTLRNHWLIYHFVFYTTYC